MPGKKKEPTKEITIAGETWEIVPLKGLKAFRLMPKVISIASELIWQANEAGFPLETFFSEEETEITFTVALKAIKFVADTLGKRYDELELRVIPFLLQKDAGWLQDNGSPQEIVSALIGAVQFHITTSFGEGVLDALKKSVAAEEEAAAAEKTDST
jgi:hypothetical protein